MATKKTPKKKPAAKKKATTTKKSSSKKAATKKVAKKSAAKKTAKKSVAKKTTKKAAAKKTTKKVAAKKVTKKTTKKVAAKKTTKKVAAKKAPAKKTTKKVAEKKAPAKKTTKKVAEKKATEKNTKKTTKKTTRRKIDFANPKSVAAAAVSSEVDAQGYVFINGRRIRAISTKGIDLKKKSRTAPVVEQPKERKTVDVSKIKTKMQKKDLDAYRDLLLQKRREIVGMVSGLESEALRSSGGNLSNMPIHMADVGSDVFEQDFTLGMAETERALLNEIDAALLRIENKTYGVCQSTGKVIPKPRLKAKPWAKFTIEAARENERSTPME